MSASLFSLEGPWLSTTYGLFKDPGKVMREFISGRRKTYYKPVAFFIVATAAAAIVRFLLNHDPVSGQLALFENSESETIQRLGKALLFMNKNVSNILFFLVFSLAAILKIRYYKRYNFAEFLSVGFYTAGMYTLMGVVLMTASVLVYEDIQALQQPLLVVWIMYCTWSLIKPRGIAGFFDLLSFAVLTLILYIVLALSFSYAWVSF